MKGKLEIKRMIEIEKMIENKEIEYPLTYNEYMYLTSANKIPYKGMEAFINLYIKNLPLISELDIINCIVAVYSCTEEEAIDRFRDVRMIIKYKNEKTKEISKERKIMIKNINNNDI